MGIVMSMGTVNLAQFWGQMKAANDVRQLAMTLSSVRAEAIRLRTNIKVEFTSSQMTWDLYDDGSTDGNVDLSSGSNWYPTSPATFTFNGLGLVRGISGSRTLTVRNKEVTVAFSINHNGFISM